MTAYAIAALRNTTVPNEEVFDYMERIQSTLDPFGGRFLVHGARLEDIEGAWPGASSSSRSRTRPRPTAGTNPTPTRSSYRCGRGTWRAS